MKAIFISLCVLIFSCAYSQDTAWHMRHIDSLVADINTSDLPVERDTTRSDMFGVKATSFLSMVMNGKEVLKFANHALTITTLSGTADTMTASNTFYFNHNKLVKVEEYLVQGGEKKTADWYYLNDKPLFYTLQSEKAKERAELLPKLAKAMLETIKKQVK